MWPACLCRSILLVFPGVAATTRPQQPRLEHSPLERTTEQPPLPEASFRFLTLIPLVRARGVVCRAAPEGQG